MRTALGRITAVALFSLVGCSTRCMAAEAAAAVEQGGELYRQYCESCHGRNMITASGLAFDLRKFPKDDAGRFRTSVMNGKGGMPSWRDTLTDEDVANLWAYVRIGGVQR